MNKNKKQLLEDFIQTRYAPVKRTGNTYAQTYAWARLGIERSLVELQQHPAQDQTARLLRDEIDFYLKRCHDYCIKERIGAHYREQGIRKKDSDFEHVVPKALTRELLIHSRISIDEALNIPTCMLSKSKHKFLNSQGHVSSTPNIWDFWQRYRDNLAGIKIETYDGQVVDLTTWNFETHYLYFNNL
jgi:hypothetical protein